jgi:hypothetical protein
MKTMLFICTAVALMAASPALAALNPVFVDPENGTDSGTCGGESLALPATGPCQSLNQALANANPGATINILKSGIFGPIYITAPVVINGPADRSAIIAFSSVAPGCIGAAAGTCGLTTANYAVEIATGAMGVVKLRNMIIDNGASSSGSVHIASASNVEMTGMTVRGAGGTIPQMVTVDSSQGSLMDVTLSDCDVGYSRTGGGIAIVPTGSTEVHLTLDGTVIQNVLFGVRLNSTSVTGGATINLLARNSRLSSMNNSALNIVAPSASDMVYAAVERTTFIHTSGAAIKVTGSGAFVSLYQSVITNNGGGINIVGGASVASLQNNEIFGNTNDCEASGPPQPCSSVLFAASQN